MRRRGTKQPEAVHESAPAFGDWLKVQEATSLLRVSRSTLYRWAAGRRLKLYRLGPRSVRVRRSELENLPLIDRESRVPPGTHAPGSKYAVLAAMDRMTCSRADVEELMRVIEETKLPPSPIPRL